jgi:hypothetical protein
MASANTTPSNYSSTRHPDDHNPDTPDPDDHNPDDHNPATDPDDNPANDSIPDDNPATDPEKPDDLAADDPIHKAPLIHREHPDDHERHREHIDDHEKHREHPDDHEKHSGNGSRVVVFTLSFYSLPSFIDLNKRIKREKRIGSQKEGVEWRQPWIQIPGSLPDDRRMRPVPVSLTRPVEDEKILPP